MTGNHPWEHGECKAIVNCTCISRTAWLPQVFQGWTGLPCESKDWLGSRHSSKAEMHSELQTGLASQSVQGWPGSQKELKVKVGGTVRTRLVLGTFGNLFSDLGTQNSPSNMQRHQNQNKPHTSRIPSTADMLPNLAAPWLGRSPSQVHGELHKPSKSSVSGGSWPSQKPCTGACSQPNTPGFITNERRGGG
jgi:hypothetical protein